ncbi:MAG TPA: GH116 family glycosyl hydrolase, partial [Chitinispirillaceae bacterium]|nr:GH116 family glycosyl hydrolase [Chitinispirillaceae bacterium]
MVLHLFRMLLLVALFSSTELWALANTMGTPLGGLGTGYLVYNAKSGEIAAVTKVMPAASTDGSEFQNHTSKSCGLHFYVKNGDKVDFQEKAKTNDENAVIPIYAAKFPAVGGVTFIDTSFGPIVSGLAYDQLVHSPMAFFDVYAKNTNSSDCEVAVALEFSNIASVKEKNLLGGANVGASDGNNAISWSGDNTAGSGYMMVGCENGSATFSSGAKGTFTTNGTLESGAGNIVAAKCVIPAGGSTRFRFVISWWSRWTLSPASDKKPGGEDHWYHNFYTNAKEVAAYGMKNYELIRSGATGIVKRTMASNFPDWYKERLLNNLYPLIHNSVAAKDGRTGYWEGQYAIIGTIDQNEHAAVWYAFNWPQNQWRELQFWARSSHKADEGALLGQVHHDFNGTTSTSTWEYSNSDINHFMYPWDNTTHDDYSYQPNTTEWMDLNCMFIFKAYELMLATGNKDSIQAYWPYIKNTANRIIVFCTEGTHLPTKSLSSYDSPDAQNWTYPSAVSLAAWYAVAEMAKWLGDAATETKYRDWYTAARADFAERYASLSSFGASGDKNHPEG